MDPQMQYAMERWNQMMNERIGVRPPASGGMSWPMLGLYRQVATQYLLNNPKYSKIDPDMVVKQMQAESNWDPQALGTPDWRGEQAHGIMQVKPSTAADMVKKAGAPEVESLMNPDENVEVGIAYLDYLKRRYKGDWRATLQRYHLGPAAYAGGKRDKEYADYILSNRKERRK